MEVVVMIKTNKASSENKMNRKTQENSILTVYNGIDFKAAAKI